MNRLINVDIDGLSSNRLFASDNRTRRNRRDTDMGIKERRTTVLKKEKKNEEKEEKNKTDDEKLDTSASSRLNTVYNTFPLASVALAELNAALAEVENQDIILLLNSALLIGGPKSGNRIKGRLECSSIDVSLLSDSIAHAMHHGCRTEAAQLLLSTAIVVREVREACKHSDWLELRQVSKYKSEGAAREWSTVVIVIVTFMT